MEVGTSEFTIEVANPATFEASVREGTVDPYAGIRIKSSDTYLYGGEDRWPNNWITYIVNSLLEIAPEIVAGKQAVVANHNGPSYFVFEPTAEEFVEITHVFSREGVDDPEARSAQAPTSTVPLSTCIETIVKFGTAYREELLSINPSLESHEDVQLLSKNIAEAEAVLSGLN